MSLFSFLKNNLRPWLSDQRIDDMWQQIMDESNVNFKNPDTHESNADNTGIRAT